MPERLFVPPPSSDEELRQLAQIVARLHYVMSIIVEHATEFVPGESAYEIAGAWNITGPKLAQLVNDLPQQPGHPSYGPPLFQQIAEAELIGDVGELKKSALNRFIDRFFSYWYSEPRTDEKRTKSAETAESLADLGATIVGSIPGQEYAVEFLSVTSQLIGERLKRGY